MPLLTLLDAQLAYGDFPLLDRAACSMESGERIGLIGRNGTGKSSLLSVIAGTLALDDGELRKSDSTRIAFVEQEAKLPHAPTVRASCNRCRRRSRRWRRSSNCWLQGWLRRNISASRRRRSSADQQRNGELEALLMKKLQRREALESKALAASA